MSCETITFCNVSLDTFKYMKKKLPDTEINIHLKIKESLHGLELWQILNGIGSLSLPSKSRKNPFSSVVMSQLIK